MGECYLIYTGGTFGSHGVPLSTLDSHNFLSAFLPHYPTLAPLANTIIKDSSAFEPQDFLALYHLIVSASDKGARRFVLITGTDSLAYLTAFLGYALATRPLTVMVVASLRPFFVATSTQLTKDKTSDAYINVEQALKFFANKKTGVFVSIDGTYYHSHDLQKIHSHKSPAFAGKDPDTITLSQLAHYSPSFSTDLTIHSVYCLPNNPTVLIKQLTPLLDTRPSAVIIIGFGAGNIPKEPQLAKTLKTLHEQGFLLVMTSACPFGGVSRQYDAGAWVYRFGVLPGGEHTIATLYAKCLWLCLTNPPQERYKKWSVL